MKPLRTTLIGLLLGWCCLCNAQRRTVWLDTDTGNEIDDLYALVRLVKDTGCRVAGISSAHFNNADLLVFDKWNGYDTRGLNTVAESQRLNRQLLEVMGRTDIPHPAGADRQVGRAWGQMDPRPSEASGGIIRAARAMPAGDTLHILTLGALTNLATAVMLAPDIIPRIRCYSLAARYDTLRKAWNKSEFNVRNDLNAFDYLMNLEALDWTILPLESAWPLQFQREATLDRLNGSHPLERILADRWREHAASDMTRIMWDLALVEAWLSPELCTRQWVNAPPENDRSGVYIWTRLKTEDMERRFWDWLRR